MSGQLVVDSRSEFILTQLGNTIQVYIQIIPYTYRKTQMVLYVYGQLPRALTRV